MKYNFYFGKLIDYKILFTVFMGKKEVVSYFDFFIVFNIIYSDKSKSSIKSLNTC